MANDQRTPSASPKCSHCGRFCVIVERAPEGESGDIFACRACDLGEAMKEPTKAPTVTFAPKVHEEPAVVVHGPFVPNVELIKKSFARHPLSKDRSFRRLIRRMRQASDLSGALIGAKMHRERGHTYRLVPAKLFDDVLAYLKHMGGRDV